MEPERKQRGRPKKNNLKKDGEADISFNQLTRRYTFLERDDKDFKSKQVSKANQYIHELLNNSDNRKVEISITTWIKRVEN